jgi:hypothetical protein
MNKLESLDPTGLTGKAHKAIGLDFDKKKKKKKAVKPTATALFASNDTPDATQTGGAPNSSTALGQSLI